MKQDLMLLLRLQVLTDRLNGMLSRINRKGPEWKPIADKVAAAACLLDRADQQTLQLMEKAVKSP